MTIWDDFEGKRKNPPAYKEEYNNEVIVLMRDSGISYRNIAYVLNIKSPSTVRNRYIRAKKAEVPDEK